MKIDINKAKNILSKGGLVIFPTETVYGLGGDATNLDAIKKIYGVKNRPLTNPLICHFSNIKSINQNCSMNELALKLADKFWPGPLTLILKKKKESKINALLSNNSKFIGCRIPNHPITNKLLQELPFPIAAPSANLSTKLSSTKIKHLSQKLISNVYILDGGESYYGLESTVIDISNEKKRILRLGTVTYEQIKKIIPNIVIENKSSNLSPGQQNKHYSPNLPIRINVKEVHDNEVLLNFGKNNLKSKILQLNLSPSGNLNEAGKNFYDYLHVLDRTTNCNGIAVAPIPNRKLGKTINDRLIRASSKI